MGKLAEVSSWLYHLGEVTPKRSVDIAKIAVGLVVIDAADDAQIPYNSSELDAMRGGDPNRLIVSYLSIGEAEDYRTYWQEAWGDAPPTFLAAANPEWQDNYKVAYWDDAWKAIVFQQVEQIISSGFNGLYLDVVDAYGYWEAQHPENGDWYREAMGSFVGEIRAHANAKLAELGQASDFILIGQNGEDLAMYPEYLAAVDGIAKEDLFYYYPNGRAYDFAPVPEDWLAASKALLERAQAAGVEIFVVEYVPPAYLGRIDLSLEMTYLQTLGAPLYVAAERDLDGMYESYNMGNVGPLSAVDAVWLDTGDLFMDFTGEPILSTPWSDAIFWRAGGDAMRNPSVDIEYINLNHAAEASAADVFGSGVLGVSADQLDWCL